MSSRADIIVHADQVIGAIKPVHGINGGGIANNYWFDFSDWYRRWRIPMVRLHDAPFDAHDTVDLHYIFPDPRAEPDDPGNYEFRLSDDYLAKLRSTGAEIYFRFGESIEHQPRLVWNDPDRWPAGTMAKVCANIVRRYNCGWADGHRWGIRYWEFWNEPHGPKNWNKTPERFFKLYREVAPAVKAADPDVKIGLAGFAANFATSDQPTAKPWAEGVVAAAADGVPVDFVSWHNYAQSWNEIAQHAAEVRSFLDQNGLEHAESHLGEWGYRPFVDGVSIFSAYKVRRFDLVEKISTVMAGHRALAHVLGTFIALQDLPVDQAQYYKGSTSSRWGVFDESGQPNLRGRAFEIFTEFLRRAEEPQRLEVATGDDSVIAMAAAEPGSRLRLVIASLSDEVQEFAVRIDGSEPGWTADRIDVFDATGRPLAVPPVPRPGGEMVVSIAGAGVVVLELVAGPAATAAEAGSSAAATGAGDW
jgi:hypothetical protein